VNVCFETLLRKILSSKRIGIEDMAPEDGDGKEEEKKTEEVIVDKDAIRQRLEELLGKQNLAEDAFILQNMNAQMYIPLTVLAQHHSLCILGEVDVVTSIAKELAQNSEKFALDEDGTMIRPVLKPRRNTLILRDLPDDFPEDELKELFNSCPVSESFCSLKPDVNNTAFASFETDEAAQSAALWLRSQKLQGSEIKCAIKSEQFVRSFFPASPGPSMQAYPMSHQQVWGYSQWGMPVHGGGWGGEQFTDPSMGNMGWGNVYSDSSWIQEGSHQAGMRDGKGDGKGKNAKGKGKGKRMRGGGSFSQDSQVESSGDLQQLLPEPQLPLGEGDDSGFEPGYTHDYRKYTRQYIIEVCNAMEEIAKPESYDRCEVALFRSSPCKDWAPLPTPMTSFANFFNDEKRGSNAQEEMGQSGSEEKSPKATWGPRGSKTVAKSDAQDYEESDWNGSWWQGQDSKRHSKSNQRYWNDWDSGHGKADQAYPQQQWVKKGEKGEQDEGSKKEEAEWDEETGQRKMSWAEKVKGAEPNDRSQRWVAKAKISEASEQDKGATMAADEHETEAPKSQSWADKVRGATSK